MANALTPDHRKAMDIQREQDRLDGVDPNVPPSTWLPTESREIKSAAASAFTLQEIEEENDD
jgi:hypothetical protein